VPKLKTHKGAASRFRRTAGGKFVRMKGERNHNRRKKSWRAAKLYDETIPVSESAVPRLKRLLPYS